MSSHRFHVHVNETTGSEENDGELGRSGSLVPCGTREEAEFHISRHASVYMLAENMC